jgi:hypothetical protein
MSNNNLEKRRDAAGPWECTDDEEWVEYEGDDEEDDNTPAAPAPAPAPASSSKNEEKVFTPDAGKVNAVQPTSSSWKADTPIKQEQQQQQTQPASSSKNTDPTPAPMPVSQKPVTGTPDNM